MSKNKFSFDTVQEFDKHIATSVSDYPVISPLIHGLAKYFIEPDDNVYDLGCSTGLLLRELEYANQLDGVSFVGYDISDNLLPKKPKRNMNFYKRDVTDPKIKLFNTSLVLSLFTLQFIQREKRERLVKKVYDSLNKGGAFIVCEKIYMDEGKIQDMFNFTHYDFKLKTYTAEEILKKQDTLKTIMRPLSDEENCQMFGSAGFRYIETFYQSLNFKGYLLIK